MANNGSYDWNDTIQYDGDYTKTDEEIRANEYIRDHLEDYLRDRGINPERNFRCLNPEHEDKKPSMSVGVGKDGVKRCHCFSCGCGANYDTFDLIGMDYGVDGRAKFLEAYNYFGLEVNGFKPRSGSGRKPPEVKVKPRKPADSDPDPEGRYKPDFTDTIKAAHEELLRTPAALRYLKEGRGLEDQTIEKYKLGYDRLGYNHLMKAYPAHATKGKKASLYRFVLPYPDTDQRCHYFLTEISDRAEVDDYNGKYRKINKNDTDLAAEIFNERYLKKRSPDVIFICEGIYDALSVEQAGGHALAFVGTAHSRFLNLCKKYKPESVFVVSLDNDTAGERSSKRVTEGLDGLGIPYIVQTAEGGKDFNDMMTGNKEEFYAFVKETEGKAKMEKDKASQALDQAEDEAVKKAEDLEREKYMESCVANHIQEFMDGISDSVNTPCIPTGFKKMDDILDGGLYEGLYIVGAITSLGKTSWVMQIVDNIAAGGTDVIVIALEMARSQLMAKSISRLTMMKCLTDNINTANAKTSRGITDGRRYQGDGEKWKGYNKTEIELIKSSIIEYSKFSDHIFVQEGIGDIGIQQVRETVERHIRITGNKPVLVIDYAQILQPADVRASDKQNMDKAILEMKRISRDHKIPVIAVSSFNRENYNTAVNMKAFKESGACEYGCDVLIGLQLKGAGESDFDVDEAKSKKPREIEAVVLKNREGETGKKTQMAYYAAFNLFKEV